MAKTFKDLTPEQVARFEAKCQQYGISAGDLPKTVNTCDTPGGVLCGHPAGSKLMPMAKVHTFNTIAEMNAMAGCSDAHYRAGKANDGFVKYPPAPAAINLPSLARCNNDVCELKNQMTLEHHDSVNDAMKAYLMGDSAKVQD